MKFRMMSGCLMASAMVLLFLVPRSSFSNGIDNSKFCSGFGHVNVTDGLCTCFVGFYGATCDLMHCPRGKTWTSHPNDDHQRYMPEVECSNMGLCDVYTGSCKCRHGFTGRACERLACPTPRTETRRLLQFESSFQGGSISYTDSMLRYDIDETAYPLCSSHGRCMSLAEAAEGFDGVSLVLPPVTYSEWDADIVQGCVCDYGWMGPDCSQKQCPKGPDPLSSEAYSPETYMLYCSASSGYFSLFVLGYYTQPVPFDADPALLRGLIEQLPNVPVGSVGVKMPSNSDGLPSVCASAGVFTEITFSDYKGQRSPIFVSTSTSATRSQPDAGYFDSGGKLRMATIYYLTCPACPSCTGDIYLTLNDSISSAIDVTATNGLTLLDTALTSELDDIVYDRWPSFEVSVSGASNGKICGSTSQVSTTKITILSTYGNIPFNLGVLDGVSYSSSLERGFNVTLTSTAGTGTLYECSNQGYCNRETGVCECLHAIDSDGSILYAAEGSDGSGGEGVRPDCGYIAVLPTNCTETLCSGHGSCTDSSPACTCYDGWHGVTCSVRECPKGYAWFDEPFSPTEAHQLAECSNMGVCDRLEGTCLCRAGFTGAACDILDCPRDAATGVACSGHGWCMSMSEIASVYGHTYGPSSTDNRRTYPAEWDHKQMLHCVCSAQASSGYAGNLRYPAVGPSADVSGLSTGAYPLPGWTGYDCSQRRCPSGDNVDARHGYGGALEIQRVKCRANSSAEFYLVMYGQSSAVIRGSHTASQIKAAIEASSVIGNVTVTFPDYVADNITVACNASISMDGFLVQFDDLQGDLPLARVQTAYPDLLSDIDVYEHQKGSKLNLECGGPEMGVCDRSTGLCRCKAGQGSSNGQGAAGSRGDCSFTQTYQSIPDNYDTSTGQYK